MPGPSAIGPSSSTGSPAQGGAGPQKGQEPKSKVEEQLAQLVAMLQKTLQEPQQKA